MKEKVQMEEMAYVKTKNDINRHIRYDTGKKTLLLPRLNYANCNFLVSFMVAESLCLFTHQFSVYDLHD